MDIEVAITLVDSLVFRETGQHLNSIQISLLRGVWSNNSYEELAETCYCSVAYLKMVGSALWTLLSKILGEKVSKRTLRAILESYHQDRKTGRLRNRRIEKRVLPRWDDTKSKEWAENPDFWFQSELLLRLTDRLDQSFNTIPSSASSHRNLISSLTEKLRLIYRLSADHYSFTPIALDIISICRNLIDELKIDFPNRIINLSLFEEPVLSSYDLTLVALIDEKLVRNILKHLLYNALQYSAPESIVTLDVNAEAQRGILTVMDQGIGIPPEELEQIFQPFYCASNTRQWSGDGLGLAIVQKSVRLHQGELSVASEMEYGSVFTVMLPIVY